MGYIVYEGRSELDGSEIVMLATGFTSPSSNRKTGPMIQTWILQRDIPPVEALKTGNDVGICGDCPARPWCYVNVGQAPSSIYRAYKAGKYKPLEGLYQVFRGRKVRLGAYGDPAAVPLSVLLQIVLAADGHTGYTHQWKTAPRLLRVLCMASVETEQEARHAKQLGYRTFRIMEDVENRLHDEYICPSESIGLTCHECGACNGAMMNAKSSIVITAHGATKNQFTKYLEAQVEPASTVLPNH